MYNIMDAINKDKRPENPRSNANIFEIMTLSWILKLIRKGFKKELDVNDLYTVLDEDSSATLGRELKEFWIKELKISLRNKKKPSFLKTLFRMFKSKLIISGMFLCISDIVFGIMQTFFLSKIIANFESAKSINQFQTLVYYAFGLIITSLLKISTQTICSVMSSHLAMQMRVSICDIIYYKALRLKTSSLDKNTTGRVVNLISNDVTRLDLGLLYLPYLIVGPLETIVVTYILWEDVGVSSLLGVATFIIFIPLQVWLGFKISDFRLKTANTTDERVSLMNEIFAGIQVIKMYTWELFFTKQTEIAREKEIKEITKTAYVKATLISFAVFNTRLALFLSILLYVLLGNYITAAKVFKIAAYFNLLRVSMTVGFPPGLGFMAELLVSIKRIEDFLLCDEIADDKRIVNRVKTTKLYEKLNNNCNRCTASDNMIITDRHDVERSNDAAVVVSNATAKWTDSQTHNTLENINLTVRPGQLVVIIGRIGAGKSSLMQAILRELRLCEGSVSVAGVVSYASQVPWLFSGSVQQNILFGLPMNIDRYNKVTKVCALRRDFKQLPYGDRTIVGERGVSLSGGQRARINLARAIYKEADIYLLDDPLSAVDANVGRHLFEKCITEYLKMKTCILITHQLQHLTNIEHIVLMENSNIIAEDSFRNLQACGYNFTKILGSSVDTEEIADDECNLNNTKFSLLDKKLTFARQISVLSITSVFEENEFNNSQVEVTTVPIEHAETRSFGSTGFRVYLSYFSVTGHWYKVVVFMLLCIFTQVLSSGGDYWITYWVNLEEHVFISTEPLTLKSNSTLEANSSSEHFLRWIIDRKTCIIVFAVLTLSSIISTLAESALFVSICMRSSTNLHNNMLRSILSTTMYFFNKNTSGLILNRFSKDIGAIDEFIPTLLLDVIHFSLFLIGILIIVGITNLYLIIPTLIVVIVFWMLRNVYLTVLLSIKRLEAITRSPVYTHLNASLQGLTTIRAFKMEQILYTEFANHQDLHSSAWYLFIYLARAFGLWLDLISLIYISIVTFSFLAIYNETYNGNVGLAITQSLGLINFFQSVFRKSAELENQMTSVERVLEYTHLPQEPGLESPQHKNPPNEWPDKGRIAFKHFYLRYELDKPFVLKNLNINIEPAEKVGIVGRTGAGKSSLIGALFRLALNEGEIFIDGVELHGLGLRELRSKLTFIPQEPIFFSGTIRTNLDLYNKYSDHDIWKALNEVELGSVVNELPDGLNSKISDGGSNFSVGQRQLVCLARAILQNNQIIVLDEVTANVDHRTDTLIQSTIKSKFQTCTVLTIAHRLHTVINSDKILVIDAGTVVEFDHPHKLLQNRNGFFYGMVQRTGVTTARLLHHIASENYKNVEHREINKT